MTDEPVKTFANVWDALEETPEDAANMRLRSELLAAVCDAVKAWRITQSQAANRLGVIQPRLNDLLRGRIDKFSLDALVTPGDRAGLTVRIEIAREPA
jgi:predicted XRE-type DNA-binding protein